MSWLRDHFYNFVFPVFMAAEQLTTSIGEPFDVKISQHAPEKLPSVLRKLWTLCAEHNVPWSWDVREINYSGGTSKYRETAALHQKILRSTLASAKTTLKHKGCSRLLLGGRDVWTFAVLCERQRLPYIFVPELSRSVASSPLIKPFLEERGFQGDELFLDTGFAGSIPITLQKHFGKSFEFCLMSQANVVYDTSRDGLRKRPNQIFPNRKKARTEALETEYLAKYWNTGSVGYDVEEIPIEQALHLLPRIPGLQRFGSPWNSYGYVTDGTHIIKVFLLDAFLSWWKSLPETPAPEQKIIQYFSDRKTIQRAALLTAQLWYGIPFWSDNLKKAAQMQPLSAPEGVVYVGGAVNHASNTHSNLSISTMDAWKIAKHLQAQHQYFGTLTASTSTYGSYSDSITFKKDVIK